MAAIIDGAPDCVVRDQVYSEEDAADFVIGDNYLETCEGFATFGPGSTYGEEGVGGESAYIILTWIGIAFMVIALIGWIVYENKRMVSYVSNRVRGT